MAVLQDNKKLKPNEESVHESINTSKVMNQSDDSDADEDEVDYKLLQPSLFHKGLAKLYQSNLMHYVITQNCDNLHHKAGWPRDHMSELHGNVFVEYCEKCLKEYVREFCVDLWSTSCYTEKWYKECATCGFNHYTGRKCSQKQCKGKLRDTIVNFGDMLHEVVLGGLPQAQREAGKADVCLSLGTSLTVTPANELTTMAKHHVICNPQVTDLDKTCSVRLWTTSDIFMELLLRDLGLKVD